MRNLEKLSDSTPEDVLQEALEQKVSGEFLGCYFDGGSEPDIDKKRGALGIVEGRVSRLEKSNSTEEKYLRGIKSARREVELKREDYKEETGLLSKAKDRILKKMGKGNKLSEIEKADEELRAKEQRRILRVEKARRLRAKLVEETGKTFEAEIDPLYREVIEKVVGSKISPILDLYREKLESGSNEEVKVAELALKRFVYFYAKFIEKLAKIPANERELILSFIAESGIAYVEDPSNIMWKIRDDKKKRKNDFGEGLIMVHKTDYIPHGKIETTAGLPQKIKDNEAEDRTAFTYNSGRGTISLSINFPVVDHMEGKFSDRDYAVLVPFSNVKDRVINVAEEDAFVVGDLPLENTDTELIISAEKVKILTAGRLKTIIKHSGASLIVTGKEGESINETVIRRIGERGYSFVQGHQDGWYSPNPEAHRLMYELAKRDNKLFGLHACTAFGELEKFMTQWLTNAYVGAYRGPDGTGDPNFRERYFADVDKYIAQMKDSIRRQGRELNEFELEVLGKIRLAAEANYQEIMRVAEEEI